MTGVQTCALPILLSFLLCVALIVMMIVVSLCDRQPQRATDLQPESATAGRSYSPLVIALWSALALVMVSLYVFFN